MKRRIIIAIAIIFLALTLAGCKKCGGNDHVDARCEHKNTEWVIVEDSTCTRLGTKAQVCNDCKVTVTTAQISLKNHTIVVDDEVEATCTENGMTEGSHCSICDEVLVEQEEIVAPGHNYKINETLSTDTILVYQCINCSDSYEKEYQGTSICTNGHTESEWITVTESTCTIKGSAHKICTVCEVELEIKSLELIDHTRTTVTGTPAKCDEDGLSDGVICSVCKKVLVEQSILTLLGHDYQITNTVSPTETEDGYIEYTCSRCNDSYQTILSSTSNYNPNEPTTIFLSDDDIQVGNNNGGVLVEDTLITISLGGEYDIIGEISEGSIKVSMSDTEQAILNLRGVNITSTTTDPIFIESGDAVDISAKADTINYIYDKRTATTADVVGGGIYSKVDLDIKGKGTLYVTSTYNNAITSTKDLEIKNLTLEVNAPNNALKGNDSITIESGTIKAISSSGDALKTENSDISDKGNQRGIITILDGTIDLYAACDGIDASYDVIINGGTISIYTESYSNYSGDVSITDTKTAYIRISSRLSSLSSISKYSAQYIFEDGTSVWVNGIYTSSNNRKYYSFEVPTNAKYVKYYAYNSSQTQGQSTTYAYCTDQLTITSSYDTYYINNASNTRISGQWENFNSPSTGGGMSGGMPGGGMNEGNPNASTYSCKGIKADNSITINGGNVGVKSHDDAIHANGDVILASGSYGSANVTINGGYLLLYSDDDALHADGTLTVNGGTTTINNSYEGVEGNYIYFKAGTVQIKSLDDGINAKTTLYFQGSTVYLDAGGDGIDSNGNIYMTSGIVLALGPTNGGNGVIDYGDGNCTFSFSGGLLLAIGCSGMNAKPTATSGNTVSATTVSMSVNSYLTITSGSKVIAVVKVTKSSQNYRVFAYNNTTYPSANVTSSTSTSYTLTNGLYYIAE